MSTHCYRCSADISADLGRQDTCPKCGKDTRVCLNCNHYDRAYNNECREEQAMRVVDKEKSTFCEWFQASTGASKGSSAPTKVDLKNAAEALFKKK